jgi:hypothetical protein
VEVELCEQVDEKVDISRILIQRLESPPATARVSSMEAANTVLEHWSGHAPEAGNTDCDVEIVFEDGLRYHGHFRLNKSQKRISLSRHVRKQLAALAAAADPETREPAADEPAISMIGADRAESARIVLQHYKI